MIKIILEASSIEDMKRVAWEFLEQHGEKMEDKIQELKLKPFAFRDKKHFSEFEITKIGEWFLDGKKPRWIAHQLGRTPMQISQKLNQLKAKGILPKASNRSRRIVTY